MSSNDLNKRIGWLDLWRAAAVMVMLAYHFLYDLAMFGRVPIDLFDAPLMLALRDIVGGSFILLAGAASRFSKNNARRGLIVFGAGLLVVAVSAAIRFPVYFGVLQLLGLCMILYGLLGQYVRRIPAAALAVGSALLFIASWPCAAGVEVNAGGLWMFGFVRPGFFSADYYPLLPWLFLFLLGTWLGGVLQKAPAASRLYAPLPRWLTWPGRHSLVIYILHQPVFYGLCWLFFS